VNKRVHLIMHYSSDALPNVIARHPCDVMYLLILYVIETLSGPPLIEIQQEQEEEDRVIEKVQRLNQKNILTWNMKRLMHIVQKGTLSTLDEQLEGSRVYEEDESAVHITDEMQAKIAATKIFINVAKQGSKCIYLDLMHFLIEDEALKAIRLFHGESETQGISKRALKFWVVNVFRERKALALSLDDTKTAVAISKDNDYQKLKSKLQSTDDHDRCELIKENYHEHADSMEAERSTTAYQRYVNG
ncbi:hypothetical protein Tco_0024538, partial [Tanacetum coccineum]